MATTKNKNVQTRIAKQKEDMLAILVNTMGIVYSACMKAGITRSTFYKWINEDNVFAEAVSDIKEQQKDFCESKILQKMQDGDSTMLIFYAKTQMRDRGYGDKREIVGKDGEALNTGPIVIEVIDSREQVDVKNTDD